jgi:hypothetical protein
MTSRKKTEFSVKPLQSYVTGSNCDAGLCPDVSGYVGRDSWRYVNPASGEHLNRPLNILGCNNIHVLSKCSSLFVWNKSLGSVSKRRQKYLKDREYY